MSNPLQFSVQFGQAQPDRQRPRGEPLRIIFLSDLGDTCASRRQVALGNRPFRQMDIDRVDAYLIDENPSIDLDGDMLTIEDLDDFHPDHLYRTLSVFQTLKDLRRRLRDPSQFDAATKDFHGLAQPASAPVQDRGAAAETDTDMFSRLLGGSFAETPDQGGPTPASQGFLNTLLADAVAAHISAEPDPRAEHYVAALDDIMAGHMRDVLHHPAFQSVEKAWRGLHMLVSNIETDENISLHVWNTSKDELLEAINQDDEAIDQTMLHRRLVADRADAPFTIILTDMEFGASDEDTHLLATLGAMAGRSGGVVLASVTPDAIGAVSWKSIAKTGEIPIERPANWDTLRATPMADCIVALGIGFMMRTPHGKKLDPIDAFAFEEINDPGKDDDAFLWGAPSLLAGIQMARAFAMDQWQARVTTQLDYGDLPFVPYDAGGEQQLKPCAEVQLNDAAADAILKTGIVPLVAVRNQNVVRFPWLQTLSIGPEGGKIGPFQA